MGTALTKAEKSLGLPEAQEEYYRGIFNLLEDFSMEKEKSLQLQRASMNILEDFEDERMKFMHIQQATLNMLDDMNAERTRLEQTQRAIMNMLEDIDSERQKTDQSKKLLESTNKELEAFSYSVSHDLQAPLRAISGFAQITMEDYATKLDTEGQRLLKLIQDNAHLMAHLIQDLLSFSRLSRQQLVSSEIDIEKMTKDVYEDLKAQLSDRIVKFKLNPLPPARGDPMMIRQVFVNLLSNALKFTKICEVAVIEVGYRREGNEGFYYVKDNGAGFDMRYVDKLFGVFQRLHTVEEFEGTGIGLALVKRIITRHGGMIQATGQINQGACISFTLSKEGEE